MIENVTLANSTKLDENKCLVTKIEDDHLSELKGGNYHEDETPKAEVESISVGQTGVRLPL